MNVPLYQFTWLFCCYALLGWAVEAAGTVWRRFLWNDRPLSRLPGIRFGAMGVLFTAGLGGLGGRWFLLFPCGAALAAAVTWAVGYIPARAAGPRWRTPGAYASVWPALLWGPLGMAAVQWLSPLLLRIYDLFPRPLSQLLVWGVFAGLTARLLRAAGTERPGAFARGCGFYKLTLLFFIGALLGDAIETLFCRLAEGTWMCRGSMVWGPLSIVWGLAFALATLVLNSYRGRPAVYLFAAGTVLGGLYEYLCSVFTEVLFGTVFWDYSGIPFNLGGRVNLFYSLFWGLATVVWLRWVYPRLSVWIEAIPVRFGRALTWCLVVFLVCNAAVTGCVLARYDARISGDGADTLWERYIDVHYDDAKIDELYPIAIRRG